jgi:hypothetical protein
LFEVGPLSVSEPPADAPGELAVVAAGLAPADDPAGTSLKMITSTVPGVTLATSLNVKVMPDAVSAALYIAEKGLWLLSVIMAPSFLRGVVITTWTLLSAPVIGIRTVQVFPIALQVSLSAED